MNNCVYSSFTQDHVSRTESGFSSMQSKCELYSGPM